MTFVPVVVLDGTYDSKRLMLTKQGFRMLVGDPNMRSRPDTKLKRQNCYRCYTGPNFGGDIGAPCQDDRVDSEALPSKPCPGGIRSNIHFPT